MPITKLVIVCLLWVLFTLVTSDEVDSFSDAMVKAINEKNKDVEAESEAMVKAIEEKAKEIETPEMEKKFQEASERVEQVANEAEKASDLKEKEGEEKQLMAERRMEEKIKQMDSSVVSGDEKQKINERMMDNKIKQVEKIGRSMFRRGIKSQAVKRHKKVPFTRGQDSAEDFQETNKKIVESLNLIPTERKNNHKKRHNKHKVRLKEKDFYQPIIKTFNLSPELAHNQQNMDGFEKGDEIDNWRYNTEEWQSSHSTESDHKGYRYYNGFHPKTRLKNRRKDDEFNGKNVYTLEMESMKKENKQNPLSESNLQDAVERSSNYNYLEGNNEVKDAETRWLALQVIGSPEFHGIHYKNSQGKINGQAFSIVSPSDVDLVQTKFALPNTNEDKVIKKRHEAEHYRKRKDKIRKRSLKRFKPVHVVVVPDKAVKDTSNTIEMKKIKSKDSSSEWVALHIPDKSIETLKSVVKSSKEAQRENKKLTKGTLGELLTKSSLKELNQEANNLALKQKEYIELEQPSSKKHICCKTLDEQVEDEMDKKLKNKMDAMNKEQVDEPVESPENKYASELGDFLHEKEALSSLSDDDIVKEVLGQQQEEAKPIELYQHSNKEFARYPEKVSLTGSSNPLEIYLNGKSGGNSPPTNINNILNLLSKYGNSMNGLRQSYHQRRVPDNEEDEVAPYGGEYKTAADAKILNLLHHHHQYSPMYSQHRISPKVMIKSDDNTPVNTDSAIMMKENKFQNNIIRHELELAQEESKIANEDSKEDDNNFLYMMNLDRIKNNAFGNSWGNVKQNMGKIGGHEISLLTPEQVNMMQTEVPIYHHDYYNKPKSNPSKPKFDDFSEYNYL